jgi:Tfp pilus assembly protein PilV
MIALVVVVLGLCAGIGVYGQARRYHRESAAEERRQQRIAARTPLQKSAADIDHAAGPGTAGTSPWFRNTCRRAWWRWNRSVTSWMRG